MKEIVACFNIQHFCKKLETETDEIKRRKLVRLVSDCCRSLEKSLGDDEALRNLAIQELGHRLRNKVATIQSIVAHELRHHKVARDAIFQRLSALSAVDMLIEAAQGQGAFIKDIIKTELGPYESSRTILEGPQIFLSAKLALVLALIVHELATNAAKYGAFSNPVGRISFFWSVAKTTLMLEWRESGGPKVSIPTNKGFGTRLLSRALEHLGGTFEPNFAATGLVCKMNLTLLNEASLETSKSEVQFDFRNCCQV